MLPRELIVVAARQAISECRREIMLGNGTTTTSFEHLVRCVNSRLEQSQQVGLPQVLNATGVLLHTGLGRSPLSSKAMSAVAIASSGYTPLEMDLRSGERGHRADVVRQQLCELTGSESATVNYPQHTCRGKRGDCVARRID
jgi:L-seryl-tRNA(Ser) seleniumtransferase